MRKDWIEKYTPGSFIDHKNKVVPIEEFVNKELILYSRENCSRSIPCIMDGLKPGQRKILYCCFKKNLKKEIKVSQLAGYVSEHGAYHHGDASLHQTITSLAQNFVGAHNINLLHPQGQFGTRLQGGDDSASARYICTYLSGLSRIIYHPDDDYILNYLNDDGDLIEPQFYLPIVPMVLINGAAGIGTGWSTDIANYNPVDIVQNIRRLLRGLPVEPMDPWYRGFEGDIVYDKTKNVYKSLGKIERNGKSSFQITELPIGVWTEKYKVTLEKGMKLKENKKKKKETKRKAPEPFVKDYKDYNTDFKVNFDVQTIEELPKSDTSLFKSFKLLGSIKCLNNMVLFNEDDVIKKYENPEQIIKEWFDIRLKYYYKRKENMVDQVTKKWKRLTNQARFIISIIEGKLVIQNRKKIVIVKDLDAMKFDRIPPEKKITSKQDSRKKLLKKTKTLTMMKMKNQNQKKN